jgi:hypothetical protein
MQPRREKADATVALKNEELTDKRGEVSSKNSLPAQALVTPLPLSP